jgi:hypothetical protein
MSTKKLLIRAGALRLIPALAYAQEHAGTPENSLWLNLIVTVLPFAILAPLVWLALRWSRKKMEGMMKPTLEHYQKQVQHMERVELSLERITKALEKRLDIPPNQEGSANQSQSVGKDTNRTSDAIGGG